MCVCVYVYTTYIYIYIYVCVCVCVCVRVSACVFFSLLGFSVVSARPSHCVCSLTCPVMHLQARRSRHTSHRRLHDTTRVSQTQRVVTIVLFSTVIPDIDTRF